MEEAPSSSILEGEIIGIKFGLATHQEICTASISDCSISHASQLSNPFLGLPLEFGKCESCGTSEPGKCEGHFGYIELPIPIYHPNHVSELKRLLSLVCLKCLKMKKNKFPSKSAGLAERMLSSCCEDASQVSIGEITPSDGSCSLQLKRPSKSRTPPGFWSFLERYGFRYGDGPKRTLLPCEVMEMLKRIPQDSRTKLAAKGYFPQDGYILSHVPVPPNCLSVPEISDGVSVMSTDPSISMLRKVLKQVEIIKGSRSGTPNFESQIVEANELQATVDQYLQVRGTGKPSREMEGRFGVNKEINASSTKAWLEKMRTLFIRKGSGFSSRSVITGDAFRRVNEVGIPYEIAQRITFEEKVNVHNIRHLQELVDSKMCLTYRDGSSTYSLREGSKGHTFLRPGQMVHRRIMDGDLVFVNRPPTTHKHSLQALQVYVHDDHVVKINPLICGPLGADFDGDCIHLFYPQSLAAKAEVLELFSVEKQLLSSHSGKPNLQLATDSLLSLKMMFKRYFLHKAAAQQLAMFASSPLPRPALLKAKSAESYWSALQMLQTALPASFDCCDDKYVVNKSEILKVDFSTSGVAAVMNDIATSVFFENGGDDVLKFFDSLQPLLMENLFSEGFSVDLEDFFMPRECIQEIQKNIQECSDLLYHLRSTYNEFVEFQLECSLRRVREPVVRFILESSALGDLIDSKSDSAINKIVQQIGFLGLQIADRGRFYSKTLVDDVASLCRSKYPFDIDYPSAEYGLVQSCFFHGLDPYEEIVHSIATREVIVRSSRGLSEPGTLFKNLMAILRDVVICYDGTVRNVCSNSIIQFEYGEKSGPRAQNLFPAGEPVGVLAATAMSNPAYKAVLDSTPSSNSSWELMKEILLCKVNFKNELIDRRVILYLNSCGCGRKYCRERAACLVKNQLKKVSLKDAAVEFMIEYNDQLSSLGSMVNDAGLVGHIHLNEEMLRELNVGVHEIRQKCQETVNSYRRKKVKKINIGHLFKQTILFASEHCHFHHSSSDKRFDSPCLMFSIQDTDELETTSQYYADLICPVLLETIIKGDPRISSANIIWINPDTTNWIRSPNKSQNGEWALDVVLEKSAVKQSGDAWRTVLDSCLPVLHLIDTRRSIPYAIKQIQELLGVSCAFDQAVQRLATAVTMVTKGVLKEHLLLLANSMTCAGNFVGFNSSGYKALSRSLSIQVPFTEATLFTPRKCFERAAEKCHTDALSSIVGSCSWGKHVAVGTGSRFDILWDTREVGLNQEGGLDVYSFLHMVSTANGEEVTTGALGAEIDDLMEDEYAEMSLSPERDSSFDRPIFEDLVEFDDNPETIPAKSSWEHDSSFNAGFGGGKDWGVEESVETGAVVRSGWGTGGISTEAQVDLKKDAWGASTAREDALSAWGKDSARETATSSWGKKTETENLQSSWESKRNEKKDIPWDGFQSEDKEKKDLFSDGWQSKNDETATSAWGKKTETENFQSVLARKAGEKKQVLSDGWKSENKEKDPVSDGWGSNNDETVTSTWGKKTATENIQSVWASKASEKKRVQSDGWDTERTEKKDLVSDGWGSKTGEVKDVASACGSKPAKEDDGWGSKTGEEKAVASAWGSKPAKEDDGWGSKTGEEKDVASAWGSKPAKEDDGWGSIQSETKDAASEGWGRKNSEKKDGLGQTSGWRNDRPKDNGMLTLTRQRLDIFTSEEQVVLSDIEPIMRSIRRIIHQSGYNDGDPLSGEDQAYIHENVFNYHPDKAVKMGSGIDHFTIDRHGSFLDSRCFFVVSTDGRKEDFSYRKCLESYIKVKFPEVGEEFNGKYFARRGGNRERNPTPSQNPIAEQTENLTPSQNSIPEQTENLTPSQNLTPEQVGNVETQ